MNALAAKYDSFIHKFDGTHEWFQHAVTKHHFTPDLNRLIHAESWWVFVYDECQKGLPNHKLIADASHTYGEAMTADKFSLWKRPLGQLTFPIALDSHTKIDETPQAHIRGKLVNVSTSKLIELDAYKENTVQFMRRRVNLNFFYHEQVEVKDPNDTPLIMHRDPETLKATKFVEETPNRLGVSELLIPHLQTVRAWMYVGVPDFWLRLTTAGREKITSGWTTEKTLAHLKYQDGSLIKPTRRYRPNNLKIINEYYYFNVTELTR